MLKFRSRLLVLLTVLGLVLVASYTLRSEARQLTCQNCVAHCVGCPVDCKDEYALGYLECFKVGNSCQLSTECGIALQIHP